MDKIIGISNIEIYEFCKLNLETGEKNFFDDYSEFEEFDGFYFKDRETFFAIFASDKGPKLYFKGNEYQLRKDLHISLKKRDAVREFSIEEYNIFIKYCASPYIGFDAWSNEDDVDLFYQIEQSYKNDEYYKKFTK